MSRNNRKPTGQESAQCLLQQRRAAEKSCRDRQTGEEKEKCIGLIAFIQRGRSGKTQVQSWSNCTGVMTLQKSVHKRSVDVICLWSPFSWHQPLKSFH